MINAGIYCGFTSNNQLEKYVKSLKQIAEAERKIGTCFYYTRLQI